jgi:hypothetical protein
MNITIDISEDVDSEGNSKKVVTKNYQCTNCYKTVRREYIEGVEELEEKEGKGANLQQEDNSSADGEI